MSFAEHEWRLTTCTQPHAGTPSASTLKQTAHSRPSLERPSLSLASMTASMAFPWDWSSGASAVGVGGFAWVAASWRKACWAWHSGPKRADCKSVEIWGGTPTCSATKPPTSLDLESKSPSAPLMISSWYALEAGGESGGGEEGGGGVAAAGGVDLAGLAWLVWPTAMSSRRLVTAGGGQCGGGGGGGGTYPPGAC